MPDKFATEFWPDFPRTGRKGTELLKSFVSIIFPYESIENLEFSQISVLEQFQNEVIIWQNGIKDAIFTKGPKFFYSAAEFFGHSGRKMSKRVGNITVWLNGRSNLRLGCSFTATSKHRPDHRRQDFRSSVIEKADTLRGNRRKIGTVEKRLCAIQNAALKINKKSTVLKDDNDIDVHVYSSSL